MTSGNDPEKRPHHDPEDADAPEAPAPTTGHSILDSIARRAGHSMRVHLRDAGSAAAAPILDPKASSFQDELSHADRGKYRVLGEIARGGMGVVLRGHDIELGRDVAMKVVHAELAQRPEVIARFLEEAQIGGQLQHPGIVPVYEIGLMADERPYFTMKLIKGRTLAAMLTRRKTIEEERLRFLTIFASACQTMAYAHSKGVIHRDLKPANIMVGAFGEVQVVDWGLSKVLRRGGVADEIAAQDSARTIIETVRSGPKAGSESLVGNVLGTPAYMSPEQAQGETDKLDERTDVFALGAILCEILTGAPPYVVAEGENLVRKAALAELDDARARIDAAQVPEELKKLCLACLLPSRQARPDNAEELAQVVQAHIAGLEVAAHEAQLEAAEERVRAERSRRRQQLTLLGLAAAMLAGAGWWWVGAQDRARADELERGFEGVRADVVAHERAGDLVEALEAARGGLRLVEAGGAEPELLERAATLIAITEATWKAEEERRAELERERQLLAFLSDVQMRQVGTGITESDDELAKEFLAALLEFGIDLEDPELGERLLELRDTELGVQMALGFDAWARVLRSMGRENSFELELLTGIGLDLDTEELRTTVRVALVERDAGALVELAADPELESAEPETLFLLAAGLADLGEEELSRRVMTTGADRNPADFALVHGAADAMSESADWLRVESYLRAAVALRPDLPALHLRISDAQRNSGDYARSIRSLELARALAPDHNWNRFLLAQDLFAMGRVDEAVEWYEREVEESPNDALSLNFLDGCRVSAGRMELEELIRRSAEIQGMGAGAWIWVGILLGYLPPPGQELQPERAIELLTPHGDGFVPTEHFWIALAAAHVNVGDGAAALEAVARGEAIRGSGNRHTLAELLLLSAVAHRMEGDGRAAEAFLERAQELRDQLVAGREEEWERSYLARAFTVYEPMARNP